MMKAWTLEVLIECDGDKDVDSLTMGLCVDADDEFMVCWKYEKLKWRALGHLK